MSHTPGPWKVVEPFRNEVYIDGANGHAVAYVIHNNDKRKEQADDARLIAAAPKLLEACKKAASLIASHEIRLVWNAHNSLTHADAVRWVKEHPSETLEFVLSIIAEAEGQ